MTRLFVYSSQFLKCWDAMGLNYRHLSLLERQLLINPKVGDVIEGTGGARKLRIQLEDNRGKSGGGRVIYIDLEQLSKRGCSNDRYRLQEFIVIGRDQQKV